MITLLKSPSISIDYRYGGMVMVILSSELDEILYIVTLRCCEQLI